MDENTKCSKRKCEDDAYWSPIRLKEQKLIESESPERVELNGKDCSVENTSNTSSKDVLKDRLINEAIEPNDDRDKDPNTSEVTNDTDTSKAKSSATILSLSDDILLRIFSYLTSNDVFNLSRCHPRLFNVLICGDKSQWIRVNIDCDGFDPSHDQQALFFHPRTTHLRFVKTTKEDRGDLEDLCFRKDFFEHLTDYAPNLQSLIIENHVLHSSTLKLKYLPNTLTELRLRNVKLLSFSHNTGYFREIEKILPNIEIVDVSYCQWFNSDALIALCKCNNLKELKMTGCQNMTDFVLYASLATTFGFKKLQTIDLRLTGIGEVGIACFSKTETLKHIYLEKPSNLQNCVNEESVTDTCIKWFATKCDRELISNIVHITEILEDSDFLRNYTLETLVIRNYPGITDIALKHAQKCLTSLKHLDVTGCSCTIDQALIFKTFRPEVELIYDGVPFETA